VLNMFADFFFGLVIRLGSECTKLKGLITRPAKSCNIISSIAPAQSQLGDQSCEYKTTLLIQLQR
jgi:hypothetical protein